MNSMAAVNGRYDYGLVVLSIVLAMCSSYAALDLAGRVACTQGRARAAWLSCGAVAMGLGIWAMHYVGMLALSFPMPVFYHLPTVALSLLAAIVASGVSLFVVSQPRMGIRQELVGSVIMGSGIAVMHYTGMAAMRCSAVIVYDSRIVFLSVALAIAVSLLGLQLAFRVRNENRTSLRKIISALVMGSSIALMHYTGMWAATFRGATAQPGLHYALGTSTIGIVAISGTIFLVLGTAIVSSSFDRTRTIQQEKLTLARERELYFQMMAEGLPDILWTADPSGADDYFNQRTLDYTGRTYEQMRGDGWLGLVHPDDVEVSLRKRTSAVRTGNAYEVEYRLRGSDGNFRWFLCRANPIRNPGGEIVKWFGTCTDIESQKHNQQILEQQILERTTELAETNTRLQEEMRKRDVARKALDQRNAEILKDLEKRSARATMLAKMGELLQSCVSRDEVIAAALGFAPKLFPAMRGAVILLNAGRSVAEVIGSWGDCQLSVGEFDPADCWALRTGHPHLVVAGDTTARCAHAKSVKSTYLCGPILAQGETLGILHFQSTDETRHLGPSELSFKTTFAGQVGLSIANIRLREALRTQSVRDALTGLYNRRHLEEMLHREIRRAGRAGQSLGVLMLDLDYFKRFNDTYGHGAGDAVLRHAASFLLKNVRAEDFVFRFGGEEFVVILPTAELKGSQTRAECLREKIKELTVLYQERSLGMVTISVGVAVFPKNGTSPQELIAAADAALYEAKRGGRDRVSLACVKSEDKIEAPSSANFADR